VVYVEVAELIISVTVMGTGSLTGQDPPLDRIHHWTLLTLLAKII
jgi:hypothetical protein